MRLAAVVAAMVVVDIIREFRTIVNLNQAADFAGAKGAGDDKKMLFRCFCESSNEYEANRDENWTIG